MCPTACAANLYLPLTLLHLPLSLPLSLSLSLLFNFSLDSFHLPSSCPLIHIRVFPEPGGSYPESVWVGYTIPQHFLTFQTFKTSTGALKRSREYWNSSVTLQFVLYCPWSLSYMCFCCLCVCVCVCVCVCIINGLYWSRLRLWIRPAFLSARC